MENGGNVNPAPVSLTAKLGLGKPCSYCETGAG